MVKDHAARYILWWSKDNRGHALASVWDLFSAHRGSDLESLAQALGIRLEFVLLGATGWASL
jgi:hypothetical protein